MNFYPLYNSIRISIISSCIVLVLGIVCAYFVKKLPKYIKGLMDAIFTISLVLPPTVIGFLILLVLGPNRPIGKLFNNNFGIKLTMNWYSAIFSTSIVIFPLMYRTIRSGIENIDEDIIYAAKTLRLSNCFIFFRITLPNCAKSIMAGFVLSFARALGEYGATNMVAGYIPGKTDTISTTVYQMWRIDNNIVCIKWVIINIAISFIVLFLINNFEK